MQLKAGLAARLVALLSLAFLLLAGAAASQEVVLTRDPAPKTFVTDFTWYRPNVGGNGGYLPSSIACTLSQPRRAFGEITAADYGSSGGYYADKYRRFRRYGIDGVALVITDKVPGSFAGDNAVTAGGLAVEAGLDFFAYYDLAVTSALESKLILCLAGNPCPLRDGQERIRWFNLVRYPELYQQIRDDLQGIGELMVQPHLDAEAAGGYYMLEDADGNRVLDEEGLPRPVIAIFIAREFADRPANALLLRELLTEVTDHYRSLGIGKPALVLDVLFWATPRAPDLDDTFDPDILEAFSDWAVAVTWYSFFDVYQAEVNYGIFNDGPRPPMVQWARQLRKKYLQARVELMEQGFPLMMWPGAATQIDSRQRDRPGCGRNLHPVVYHLRSEDDWRFMLRKMREQAWRPAPAAGPPLQSVLLVNNGGEWLETGAIDVSTWDSSGRCAFPYNWCRSLLEVIREETAPAEAP